MESADPTVTGCRFVPSRAPGHSEGKSCAILCPRWSFDKRSRLSNTLLPADRHAQVVQWQGGRERGGRDSGGAISVSLCNLKIRGKGRNEKVDGRGQLELRSRGRFPDLVSDQEM